MIRTIKDNDQIINYPGPRSVVQYGGNRCARVGMQRHCQTGALVHERSETNMHRSPPNRSLEPEMIL